MHVWPSTSCLLRRHPLRYSLTCSYAGVSPPQKLAAIAPAPATSQEPAAAAGLPGTADTQPASGNTGNTGAGGRPKTTAPSRLCRDDCRHLLQHFVKPALTTVVGINNLFCKYKVRASCASCAILRGPSSASEFSYTASDTCSFVTAPVLCPRTAAKMVKSVARSACAP